TYREPTRREGITRLRGLASRDDVGGPARSAWRQALLWLNATRADAALYDEFLKIQPNDREVAAKRAQLRDQATGGAAQQDPNQRLLAEGFRALEGGDDAVAEARFAQVLRARPRDPEAMGGLGSVRLRQQRFAEASELLRPAAAANRKWKQAADTAQYWVTLQDARNGGPDAVRKVSAAVQLVPREPAGHVLLAQLQEGSDPAAAEAGYRKALELDPANAGALQGLVGLLGRQGRAAEAASLYERLTPEQRERADRARGRAAGRRPRPVAAAGTGAPVPARGPPRPGARDHGRPAGHRRITADPARRRGLRPGAGRLGQRLRQPRADPAGLARQRDVVPARRGLDPRAGRAGPPAGRAGARRRGAAAAGPGGGLAGRPPAAPGDRRRPGRSLCRHRQPPARAGTGAAPAGRPRRRNRGTPAVRLGAAARGPGRGAVGAAAQAGRRADDPGPGQPLPGPAHRLRAAPGRCPARDGQP